MWLNQSSFYQYTDRRALKILIVQFDILNPRALGVGIIASCIHEAAKSPETGDTQVMLCRNKMIFTFLLIQNISIGKSIYNFLLNSC